jgi:hypothetical protein
MKRVAAGLALAVALILGVVAGHDALQRREVGRSWEREHTMFSWMGNLYGGDIEALHRDGVLGIVGVGAIIGAMLILASDRKNA